MTYHIQVTESDETEARHIHLAGELCIFNAADLKDQLLEHITSAPECELNLMEVSEVDLAGLQLLMVAKRESLRCGCNLSFTNHSEPLLQAMGLLSVGRNFDDLTLVQAKGRE